MYFTLWLTLNEHEIYILSINFCESEKSVKRSVAITVASTRESGCARCEHRGNRGVLQTMNFVMFICNHLNICHHVLTLPTKTYSFSSPIMDSHISMIVYEGLHTFCHYPYSPIIIKKLLRHRMI